MARILVVDDDAKIRNLLRVIIENQGHEVLEAADTPEALELLEQEPDAIFVDVNLPGESGAQFVLRLRQHLTMAGTPAIFVTAFSERIIPVLGADIFDRKVIEKPFRKGEVIEALDRMLARGSHRRHRRVRLDPSAIDADIDGHVPARVRDISVGGLFLISEAKRKLGDAIRVTIAYENMVTSVDAKVAHVHSDGLGCVFESLSRTSRSEIARMIEGLLEAGAILHEDVRARRTRTSVPLFLSAHGKMEMVELRDISTSGAFVTTTNPPAVRSTISVYVPSAPSSNTESDPPAIWGCTAVVVRQESNGFACRFEKPSPDFRKAVFDLLESE